MTDDMALLPPEILAHIGSFADIDTRRHMRLPPGRVIVPRSLRRKIARIPVPATGGYIPKSHVRLPLRTHGRVLHFLRISKWNHHDAHDEVCKMTETPQTGECVVYYWRQMQDETWRAHVTGLGRLMGLNLYNSYPDLARRDDFTIDLSLSS